MRFHWLVEHMDTPFLPTSGFIMEVGEWETHECTWKMEHWRLAMHSRTTEGVMSARQWMRQEWSAHNPPCWWSMVSVEYLYRRWGAMVLWCLNILMKCMVTAWVAPYSSLWKKFELTAPIGLYTVQIWLIIQTFHANMNDKTVLYNVN